jgi:predicted dithiol-disulfide oxidoreductase (DUF899 family)
MTNHPVVSRKEWLAARAAFLDKEKAFTRQRDELNRQRRELAWVKVDKAYAFDGPNGKETLAELFEHRSQLVVYHFIRPDAERTRRRRPLAILGAAARRIRWIRRWSGLGTWGLRERAPIA